MTGLEPEIPRSSSGALSIKPHSALALAAAEQPYTPLILVGKELKLGQFRQQEFWSSSRSRSSRSRSTILLEHVIDVNSDRNSDLWIKPLLLS